MWIGQGRELFVDSADALPAARLTSWTLCGELRGHYGFNDVADSTDVASLVA